MKKHKCSTAEYKSEFASALAKLKAYKVKVTAPRTFILDLIIHYGSPFSADDLVKKALKSKGPELDRVTVYRTLATFAEIGVIIRCDFGDGIIRFELASVDGNHHHHVICTSCKKIEPLNFCVIEGQGQIIERMGYKNLSHRLEFFGVCPSCAS